MKAAIFFITAPIMYPIILFFVNVYGEDTNGHGWYQDVWAEGSWLEVILAVLVTPIIWLARFILLHIEPMWEELLD